MHIDEKSPAADIFFEHFIKAFFFSDKMCYNLFAEIFYKIKR